MATTVKFGSARIDENGKATGGKPGDQTGKEVSTQSYYTSNKGWVLLRCVDPVIRGYIAEAMESACKNSNIGYNQAKRNTLYNLAKEVGFDPKKVEEKCETDCSALVRVCVLYAVRKFYPTFALKNFNTSTEASVLINTGLFEMITDKQHVTQSAYLMRGDILVTRTKGHTVVVLNDGSRAKPDIHYATKIKYGDVGPKVKALQYCLMAWLPGCLKKYGADGEFGSETEEAVKLFQFHNMLDKTGIVDDKEWEKLESYISASGGHEVATYGDVGTNVVYMQDFLLKWKGDCLPKCGADGDFGQETLKALKAFEAEKGLNPDGICDYLTWIFLQVEDHE